MQPRDSQSSFKSLSGASPLAHYYRLLSLPPLSARHKRWIETQKIMVRSVTCDVLSSRRPSVLTFLSVKTAEAQGMIRLRKYIFQNYLIIEVTIEADSAAKQHIPMAFNTTWPSQLSMGLQQSTPESLESRVCDSLKHRPRFDFCGIFPLPLNNSRENSVYKRLRESQTLGILS